ncbi:Do family serine endopeptidase [Psychromonas sp.]|nr:Do family serine endopeptidase [Psychromonas sp.]
MRFILRQLFILTLITLSMYSNATLPIALNGQKLPTLAPLIKQVSPAVVDISVSSANEPSKNLLDFLQPNRPQIISGQGSGVIIDADNGYIITNYHVIEGASQILIGLVSGHQYSANIIGQDPKSDIALLQIKSKQPLTAIKFANSDDLQVGDFTIAIGNPFGLGQTVTSGIVSALGRSGLNLENLENYIQTDAAINSGNSGGALLNLKGELIGINTAIFGPNGGNVGIAFAIPSNMVKNLSQQLLEFGEVRRGILGIKGGEVTAELANSFALNVSHGAFIYEVTPNSAADKAGLKAGDVVTAINGKEIRTFAALRAKIGTHSAGKKISLTIIQNNQTRNIGVILGGVTESVFNKQQPSSLEGATLKDIVTGQEIAGVEITEVKQNSIAERVGLKKEDIIIAVNRSTVHNQTQLFSALSEAGDMQALNILRNNRSIYIILE